MYETYFFVLKTLCFDWHNENIGQNEGCDISLSSWFNFQ